MASAFSCARQNLLAGNRKSQRYFDLIREMYSYTNMGGVMHEEF